MTINIKLLAGVLAAVFLISAAIGFQVYKTEQAALKEKEKTDLEIYVQDKATTTEAGTHIELLVQIKNTSLKDFEKTFDPSCENPLIVRWEKDGKLIEPGHGECDQKEKRTFQLGSARIVNYILTKDYTKPGKYTATIKTFGKETKRVFTIKEEQQQENKEE